MDYRPGLGGDDVDDGGDGDDDDGDDEGGGGESVAGENFRTLYNLVIFLARCKIRQKDKKRREKRDHLVIFLVRPLQNCHDDDRKASKEVNIVKLVKLMKQVCKPRRFDASLKLCPQTHSLTYSLTGVKCRATSVAKNNW